MMRSSNPALSDKTFQNIGTYAGTDSMTIQGTVNKTGFLLLLVVAGAAYTWSLFLEGRTGEMGMWMMGGLVIGIISALVTIFKKEWAAIGSTVYALAEGLVLGAISSIMEAQFPGIVIQAVALTFGTAGVLLVAYKSGLIQVTEKFRLGVIAATGSIALIYVATWILGFFGINIPYIHENGLIGIGFSLVVVVVAALNLVLDFDFIEQGAANGAPKYMEWYGAFGLMVTLIWLYLEILRLLSKLNSRR